MITLLVNIVMLETVYKVVLIWLNIISVTC